MTFTRYQTLGWAFLLALSSVANAQDTDCRNYPKASQSKFEMTPKGPKIVVTVEKSVNFDDSDARSEEHTSELQSH